MSTTRIFGYMRFSYLGRSDVKLARRHDDLEYRKSVLYAPDRLEERFYFFEKICLPSLKWQSDQDFRFAIFTSPELPEPFQQRLARVTSDLPQVEIVYDTAAHINDAIHPWMARQDVIQDRRTLHFRLDDDDALSTDFVATLHDHIDRVPENSIISRPTGLFLMNAPEGPQLLAKFEPHIAIGFAIVNGPGKIRNPYALMHRGHHRMAPSLSLPWPLAYIHTAHAESDTIAAQAKKLAEAKADHDYRFGNRPRRFMQAVRASFNDLRPEHFTKIIQNAPSLSGQPPTEKAPV
ncbi:glycosyltransferase [Paracoccus xiamenensis]|uniref:glycosyltransferase n=1 Tax=Paracoccus xiamenensis TaxID=2714901 RepID=UPI0014079FCF|nr:glycosyltransferase [Paracoccus xiamenensis]NHF74652.1 hypothetical protein [Paracoccus xiamenensis]